eukprot:TRINITY_DN109427_c0_g1_i1.p1 TRINITY_DN109427_c0_g1~~TRINITY_DN109427_c0_g1_i1.p1  ORF type:complete len:263 (+),score=51.91 TRINITY_DN109427_c0_g1_i1:99-791(+)
MCAGCSRPASACICGALPHVPLALPAGLESVILLRHPKERRQKHQSAWILERCVSGVRQHVTRRLPARGSAPAGLEHLYEQPETCLLVFPGPGARPLREVLDPGVRHLVFVDATWRFAREMASASSTASSSKNGCSEGAALEPLAAMRRAELTPPPGTRPVFVVRKPLLLGRDAAPADCLPADVGSTEEAADAAAGDRWGFSTAEAVALALDEVAVLRGGSDNAACPREA